MQEDYQNFEGSDEISYKGYTSKYLHHDQFAVQAFNDIIHKGGDPVAILNALKATDDYMGHEIAAHAEKLVVQIEADLEYDEEGRSFFKKEKILNLVFRVADFMRQLSKRI